MGEHIRIQTPKLLIVEGVEDVHLMDAMIKHLMSEHNINGLKDVQILKIDGYPHLKESLEVIYNSREYKSLLSSIAIVVDADNNAADRFRSICTHLKNSKYSVPSTQLTKTESKPSVIVLTVPRNEQGMIEDICLKSVSNDPAMKCVDHYIECVSYLSNSGSLDTPRNLSKAKLQAFLASRKEPGLRMGIAAKGKCFPFDDSAFDDIKQLLKLLAE